MANQRSTILAAGVGAALTIIVFVGFAVTGGVSGSGVGAVAPPISVGSTSLEDKRGKVVLVDFWATWCGPCRESLPRIQELYSKYKDQGFEVMAISDEPEQKIKAFAATRKFSFSVYSEPSGKALKDYKVEGIPHEALIARNGKVIYESEGFEPAELEAAIKRALAQK